MYTKFLKLLTANKKSSYAIAKATGISQSTLRDWKIGRSTPKIDKIQKIADYFGVPLDYFYKD